MQSFLEIGCGTGFVLSGIAKQFPFTFLNGRKIFTEGLRFAAKRLPSVNLMQMDARAIPFHEKFDVIGAFDVLEHIKEDVIVLNQIHKALKPDGIFLLMVPQHAWLWSFTDEYARHERRYSVSELNARLLQAGFKVLQSTSFVTTLLPAMILSRFFHRKNLSAELKISPLLNSVFEKVLLMELFLIKCGLNLPIGGSRLVLAQKIQ